MIAAVASGVDVAARWRLLSLGFTAPSEAIVDELETLAESLEEREGSELVGDILEALREASVDILATQYHVLFGGTVRISPYEAGYEIDPVRQGRVMADVAAFYRAFGAVARGPAAERPDHIGCELEYLAFLELRRVAALEKCVDTAPLDAVATSFLRDHAGRWLPAFFANVREAAIDRSLYRALACLGVEVLRAELARRGLEHVAGRSRISFPSVEPEQFDCG